MGFSLFDQVMFNVVPIFIFIMFIIVFGVFIVTMIQATRRWKKNNDSPILTVDAKVVAKRAHVRRRSNDNFHRTSTDYFVTFEVASGDRMELHMEGEAYGLLIEKDKGELTFQGTRYLDFKRL